MYYGQRSSLWMLCFHCNDTWYASGDCTGRQIDWRPCIDCRSGVDIYAKHNSMLHVQQLPARHQRTDVVIPDSCACELLI